MKKILLLIPLALCLSPRAAAQTQPPAPSPVPRPVVTAEAPKFLPEEVTGSELRDLSGRAFRLSDFRGRVYVINLWATWCGPCRLEIPGLNKVYEEYRARGVELVGLTTENPEESSQEVREFVKEFGMTYRVAWAEREMLLKLFAWSAPQQTTRPGRSNPIPQTFVVAADGRVVLRLRGYNARVPEMVRAAVRQALELPAPPPSPTPPAGLESGPRRR